MLLPRLFLLSVCSSLHMSRAQAPAISSTSSGFVRHSFHHDVWPKYPASTSAATSLRIETDFERSCVYSNVTRRGVYAALETADIPWQLSSDDVRHLHSLVTVAGPGGAAPLRIGLQDLRRENSRGRMQSATEGARPEGGQFFLSLLG